MQVSCSRGTSEAKPNPSADFSWSVTLGQFVFQVQRYTKHSQAWEVLLSGWCWGAAVHSIQNSETGHVSNVQNWGKILTLNHLLQDSQVLSACFHFWSSPDCLYHPGQFIWPLRHTFVYSSSIHLNKVPKLGAWAPTSFSVLSVQTA